MIQPGQYIVGPRYAIEDITSGVNSIKLGHDSYLNDEPVEIPTPIAGAIKLACDGLKFYAICEQCFDTSNHYKRQKEPALFKWARAHRCEFRMVPSPEGRRRKVVESNDRYFLLWLRLRLINIYAESPNTDFVQRLHAIAQTADPEKVTQ